MVVVVDVAVLILGDYQNNWLWLVNIGLVFSWSFRGGAGGYDNDFGGGGGDFEVLVPKAAVGVVIGKGGDMIKKIQNETGCRVQFQQARDEGPGDRRCFLSGNPKQIEHVSTNKV